MNFKEFATKNVQRNSKAYFGYFLSSTISSALLFSFTMIILHPGFEVSLLPSHLKTALYMTTIIAYLFLCFFVFYSISVFLKSRYKEFGILYIIGASKKQVQKMIGIENFIISLASALIGILLGFIFSKILLAASGKLLGYNALGFYIPYKAMIITLSAFIIIGMVISVFCSSIIREDKVIALLKGTKKPKPEPRTSIILVGLCIGLITLGYFMSVTSTEKTITYRIIPVTGMVIVATYLLFSQLSIFIIKLIKKKRSLYMRKTTVLWVSNLLYRIKDNVRMFFLITITTTVALSAIGSVYAYWRDKENQIDSSFPQGFFYSDAYNNKEKVNIKTGYIEDLLKDEKIEFNKVSSELKFVTPNSTKDEIVIINEESYKKLSSMLSLTTLSFNDNETINVVSLNENKRKDISFGNIKLSVRGKSDKEVLPRVFENVYVVKDKVYENIKGERVYFGALNIANYKETLNACRSYEDKFGREDGNKYNRNFLKANILESTKIAYGVILFSVIFIGLIFFVTTASFLYNKCYMDIIEDKKKYKQLNKIGLTYKEIKKTLNVEIGVLFLLPYIVAVVHFFFAISSLKAFDIKITVPALQVIGMMLITQIIYFFIIRKNYLLEIKKELLL